MCRKRMFFTGALGWIAAVGAAQADIQFKIVAYPIAEWPDGFTAIAWTFTRFTPTEKVPRLIVAGLDTNPPACKLLTVALGPVGGKVTEETLRLAQEQCPTHLASVDLRGDGVDDLVLTGAEPTAQRMLAPVGAKYKEVDLPFPRLRGLVAVWLDQPSGGPDLFLTGLVPMEGEEAAFRRVPGRLYRNQDGKLVPTDQVVEGTISSAQVIDLDADGRCELLVFPDTGAFSCQRTRVFRIDGHKLVEVERPLEGLAALPGIGNGSGAVGDIEGIGRPSLILSGTWNRHLAAKGILTVVYQLIGPNAKDLVYMYSPLTETLPNIEGKFLVEDLDGDGRLDVFGYGVGANLNEVVVCFQNTARGLLEVLKSQSLQDQIRVSYNMPVVPVDVNGDGLRDFVLFPACKSPILLLNVSKQRDTQTTAPPGSAPSPGSSPGLDLH